MIGRAIPFVLFAAAVVTVGLLFGWGYAAAAFVAGLVIWLAWEVYNSPSAVEDPLRGFVITETAQERRARKHAIRNREVIKGV